MNEMAVFWVVGGDMKLVSALDVRSGNDRRVRDSRGEVDKLAERLKPPKPYPYEDDLKQVELFIQQSEFGTVGKEIIHFTHQLKAESLRYFEKTDDASAYILADSMQSSAVRRIFFMRLLTLATFILYATFSVGRMAAGVSAEGWLGWSPFENLLHLIGLAPTISQTASPGLVTLDIAVAGVALLMIRVIIRHIFLYWRIDPEVRISRGALKSAHERLVNACQKIAGKISDIDDDEIWPDWAAKTAKVALWYAMRADYLDRYSTTCLWKLRRTFVVWEWAFRAAKIATVAALLSFAILLIGPQNVDTQANLPFLLPLTFFMVAAYLGWDLLHRAPNEFVTIRFQQTTQTSARTHYFDAFASEYSQMVNMVIKATRG